MIISHCAHGHFLYMYEIRSESEGVGLFLTYKTFMMYFIKHLLNIYIYMAILVFYSGCANDMCLHLYMFDVINFECFSMRQMPI